MYFPTSQYGEADLSVNVTYDECLVWMPTWLDLKHLFTSRQSRLCLEMVRCLLRNRSHTPLLDNPLWACVRLKLSLQHNMVASNVIIKVQQSVMFQQVTF